MVCILRLLGLAPKLIPVGRGFVEAMGAGIQVDPGHILFRCNIISTDHRGIIRSSCPASLNETALIALAQRINQEAFDLGMQLLHTEGYKLLLVCKGLDPGQYIPTQPPHQHIGQGFIAPNHPKLRRFLELATPILRELSSHELRYQAALWDFSAYSPLPSFYALWGARGAMVCGTAIAAGIGRGLGMEVSVPEQATGDIDTNLRAKLTECLDLMRQFPFVFCHINGTDEASHRRDPLQKAAFLSKIDQELLAPLLQSSPSGTVIRICSDHGCSSTTGRHLRVPIPLISYTKQ